MLTILKKFPRYKRFALIQIILFDIFILLSSLWNDEIWMKVLGLLFVSFLTYRILLVIRYPELIRVPKIEMNIPSADDFRIELSALSNSVSLKDYQSRYGLTLHKPSGFILSVALSFLLFYSFTENGGSVGISLLMSVSLTLVIFLSSYLGTKLSYNKLKKTKYIITGSNSENLTKIKFKKEGEFSVRIKIGNSPLNHLIMRESTEEIDEVYSALLKAKEIRKYRS